MTSTHRPRPILEMTPGEARRVEGVLFDVDDTMTRDGVLEVEAYEALFRLRAAGLSRVAVTGRPLGWSDVIAATWPVDCALGENGAGWAWRERRALRRGTFTSDATERAREIEALARARARVARELPDVRESADSLTRRCDVSFDVGEAVTLDAPTRARLASIIEEEGLRVTTSSIHCHAVPGPWDKALGGVRALRSVLGVEEERARSAWLFVGDSGNDLEAFRFFEMSAGPANVLDHALPVVPRWVATKDRGRGFAEIVDVLLTRRAA